MARALPLLLVLLSGCRSAPNPTASRQQRTLVLYGGNIFTGDPAHPRARALFAEEGRITAVGTDAEILARRRAGSQVIDLRGRAVLPALSDAHGHLYGLGLTLDRLELRGCASEAACAERVRRFAAEGRAPGGQTAWLEGRGWDQNLFADPRFPSHETLDRVLADRPVWLRRVDGHAGWANARAMAIAGVSRGTAPPKGGKILRNERGEPTGVFIDEAMALIEHAIAAPSMETRQRAILRAEEVALAHGLTSVHEMGLAPETIEAYRALDRRGLLRVRVYGLAEGADPAALDRIFAGAPDPKGTPRDLRAHFVVGGIKLYADGALGSRGAALLAPYSDDPQNQGLEITSGAQIEAVARRALATGWQVAVHAIGDRANRAALDAFERAAGKGSGARFRVEHAQVVAPEELPRFALLGVIASMQPTHATSDMPWAEARLGPERMRGAYAWRTLLDSGAHLSFGSDFPVEELDPIAGGLFAAVTRTNRQGLPRGGWHADQRLTLDEAVHAFTEEAAYAAFEEGWRGRAQVGQAADLTVLDRDLPSDDPHALLETRVDLTIVGGETVFQRLR